MTIPSSEKSPLENATLQNNVARVAELLKSKSCLQTAKDDALILAAWYGRDHILDLLLGDSVFCQTTRDLALQQAATHGHARAADCLIRHGANPSRSQNLCLLLASAGGHVETIKVLLNRSAYSTVEKNVALYKAISSGQIDAAALLLACGADPNIRDTEGRTPLMLVAASGTQAEDFVPLLLNAGADASLKDAKGQTATDIDRNRTLYRYPSHFEKAVATWKPPEVYIEAQRQAVRASARAAAHLRPRKKGHGK